MAKYGYKKTKNGFSFYGDLQECINAAKRRLENLHKNTAYIVRVYYEARSRRDAHFKAIETATDFIEVATEHLKNRRRKMKQTKPTNKKKSKPAPKPQPDYCLTRRVPVGKCKGNCTKQQQKLNGGI